MSPALFANPKAHVQDSQACLLGHTRAQVPAQGHGHPSPPARSPAELGHMLQPQGDAELPPSLPRAASRSRCRICHPFVTQKASPRTREASLLLTHPGLPLFSADTRRVPGASARTLHVGRGLSGAVVAQSEPQTPKHFSSSSSQGVFREPILVLPCYCHPPADFAAQTSPNIKSSLFDAPIARPIGFLMLRRAQIIWGGRGVFYFSQKS